jgi:hypothetical protein
VCVLRNRRAPPVRSALKKFGQSHERHSKTQPPSSLAQTVSIQDFFPKCPTWCASSRNRWVSQSKLRKPSPRVRCSTQTFQGREKVPQRDNGITFLAEYILIVLQLRAFGRQNYIGAMQGQSHSMWERWPRARYCIVEGDQRLPHSVNYRIILRLHVHLYRETNASSQRFVGRPLNCLIGESSSPQNRWFVWF